MKIILLLISWFTLVGCATPRTKDTDPTLRVFIDPMAIDKTNYARLVTALKSSGKYIVVDRADGFEAAKREQDFQYTNDSQRVDARERYATYFKMFGAGGVVAAKSMCHPSQRFWSNQGDFDCLQNLSLIDARTGEVIATAEHLATDAVYFYGELRTPASWGGVVKNLNANMPANFTPKSTHPKIVEREDEAEQTTQNMRVPAHDDKEEQP